MEDDDPVAKIGVTRPGQKRQSLTLEQFTLELKCCIRYSC